MACLRRSLTAFWSDELNRTVVDKVVVDAPAARVPAACRRAIKLDTAFTCPVDGTVYLTAPFVRRLSTTPPAADAQYRFAATMAHEMGHVVQLAVHERLAEKPRNTLAESRQVEQQADCLSGVWAAGVGLSRATFARGAAVVFQVVDSRAERLSHGTPAVRQAAIARGFTGGSSRACALRSR